jgi:hypothetical protein
MGSYALAPRLRGRTAHQVTHLRREVRRRPRVNPRRQRPGRVRPGHPQRALRDPRAEVRRRGWGPGVLVVHSHLRHPSQHRLLHRVPEQQIPGALAAAAAPRAVGLILLLSSTLTSKQANKYFQQISTSRGNRLLTQTQTLVTIRVPPFKGGGHIWPSSIRHLPWEQSAADRVV